MDRFSQELKTNFWWLSFLYFTASTTKGKNYWKWNQLFLTAVKTRVETAAVVSFKQLFSRVHFYDRWSKLKTGLTEIIYQRPSIFVLLYWSSVKALSLMFLEKKNFLFRAFTWNRNLIKLSCTILTHQEHLNGFRRQKKLVLNFIITKSLTNSL